MDTFLDVSGIVKRAKQALNFKKDSELANYLGVSRPTGAPETGLTFICCSTK